MFNKIRRLLLYGLEMYGRNKMVVMENCFEIKLIKSYFLIVCCYIRYLEI